MKARGYRSYFRIRFIRGLQYRAAALAGIATQFAWGFLRLLLFHAFYSTGAAAFPMTFPQLASYIWLEQAFLALLAGWYFDDAIFASITEGTLAYELARPLDLYGQWFAGSLAGRLARAVLRCMPILLVAFFLPAPFNLSLPSDALSAAVFVPTLVLGLLIMVALEMLCYIATLHTLSPRGIRMLAVSLIDFLSGGLLPLPFLPAPLRAVLECLPFAYTQNLPLRIYSGNIAGAGLARGVALQVFWLAVLVVGGKWWMDRSLKRVVVQGG